MKKARARDLRSDLAECIIRLPSAIPTSMRSSVVFLLVKYIMLRLGQVRHPRLTSTCAMTENLEGGRMRDLCQLGIVTGNSRQVRRGCERCHMHFCASASTVIYNIINSQNLPRPKASIANCQRSAHFLHSDRYPNQDVIDHQY